MARRAIRFAQVLAQLMEERYSRNRAELARAAFITPSALSQYARGKASPSLEVLAQLATVLDVSLDYLVFGEQPTSAATGEVGYLAAQVETGLRDAQVQSAALYDLVARIGERLGGEIEATARAVLPEAVGLGGSLSADELTRLESHSSHTRIANYDLDLDIVLVRAQDSVGASPGPIAHVVIDNIRKGHTYDYVLPEDPDITQRAILFRQIVVRETPTVPAAVLDRRLQIYQAPHGCLPGFVVYKVDIAGLESGEREIYNRVSPFFVLDREEAGAAFVGVATPASRSMRNYILTSSRNTAKLITEHDWLKTIAQKLTIRAIRSGSEQDNISDGRIE